MSPWGPEAVDFTRVGPPLHGGFANSQQVGDLPGGQEIGLHGAVAPVYDQPMRPSNGSSDSMRHGVARFFARFVR
jgi:hypothetical protein